MFCLSLSCFLLFSLTHKDCRYSVFSIYCTTMVETTLTRSKELSHFTAHWIGKSFRNLSRKYCQCSFGCQIGVMWHYASCYFLKVFFSFPFFLSHFFSVSFLAFLLVLWQRFNNSKWKMDTQCGYLWYFLKKVFHWFNDAGFISYSNWK